MNINFNELRQEIESLNIANGHEYRSLVNYLDNMAPHANNPDSNEYKEYKSKFIAVFNELGLDREYEDLLKLL